MSLGGCHGHMTWETGSATMLSAGEWHSISSLCLCNEFVFVCLINGLADCII